MGIAAIQIRICMSYNGIIFVMLVISNDNDEVEALMMLSVERDVVTRRSSARGGIENRKGIYGRLHFAKDRQDIKQRRRPCCLSSGG